MEYLRKIGIFTPVLLLLFSSSNAYGLAFSIRDLGVLNPSGSSYGSIGHGVNDLGVVVGNSTIDTTGNNRAFIDDGSGMRELEAFGSSFSNANAINNSGIIVGEAVYNEDGGFRSAFIADETGFTNLGTLGGDVSFGADINDSGIVVGSSQTSPDNFFHVFKGDKNGITDLGTLGGNFGFGRAINSSGIVTGDSGTSEGFQHAFIGDEHGLFDLGTLGGFTSFGNDLNDFGLVVGSSDTGTSHHAFIGDENGLFDLGTLGGNFSRGYAVNNSGFVVGSSHIAPGSSVMNAFLWNGDEMFNLNDLIIDMSGWNHIEIAYDISETNYITGWGRTSNNSRHAFVLSPHFDPDPDPDPDPRPNPVPEPPIFALFALGLAGLKLALSIKQRAL